MTNPWNAAPGELSSDYPDPDDYCDDDDGCWECGGEGWIENECFEDTCCCADPEASHGIRPCWRCNPQGK